MSAEDEIRRRGPARTYANEAIEVQWDPRLCIHTQSVRGLGEVFDPEARPWVRVDQADAERIAEAVVTCPTGALPERSQHQFRGVWCRIVRTSGSFRAQCAPDRQMARLPSRNPILYPSRGESTPHRR